jgi:tetratricopeptide (TPR) repeat protein
VVQLTEEEILYLAEAAKRLIEIGQLDEAKNIVKGLLVLDSDLQAVVELAAFLFTATGEFAKAEELIEAFAAKHPFLPFHLGIFLVLSRALQGKSKEALAALELVKRVFKVDALTPLEARALNFVENLISFVKK